MSEATFDLIASEYDESMPAHVIQHYLDKRVAYVRRHTEPGSALDVGCGTGVLAQRLADEGYAMSGVDPSQGMLDVAARRAPAVSTRRGEGSKLPYEDDSFDLALSVATMHHIAEPAAVRETLREMVRVTRPGGRVLVWDHNPRNPYWRLLMARVPQDDGSERLVPASEVLDGLRAAGAEPLLCEQLGFVPDFVPRRMLGAAKLAESAVEAVPGLRQLCAHNVVLARS